MKYNYTLILLLFMTAAFAQPKNATADFDQLPTVAWRFSSTQPFIASPVVSEGLVYVGGLDSTLYALNLTTGAVQWKLKTNGEIRSNVLVHGPHVFLLGGNGVLSCLDKQSGKVVWRQLFDNTALFLGERRYDWADYYHTSPVVYEDLLLFGTGNSRFQAVKVADGTPVWSFQASDIIHNTAVVQDGKVYFGSFDGQVYSLHAATGQLLWQFKTVGHRYFPRGEVQGSPAAGMGSVFIGARDYNFYALNGTSGYAHWNRTYPNGWALSATYRDSVIYVGTSDDRVLLALDAVSGQERWRTNVKFNIFGGCAFTPQLVYVGTLWGKLYGIDRKTGAIRWAFATDGYQAHHLKYFKEDDTYRDDIGRILPSARHAIEAEYRMGGIFSTPAVSGNWLVLSTAEGKVYGLKR
ncbi:MAG: PQQ-binding-like beta-propeller repeat protein [Bacteroidota bacterium]